jgi:T5SS/PEP-CTERM-associated repeat protein
VGNAAVNNRLVISNGGRVTSPVSFLGGDHTFGGSNNVAIVTGTGSVWETSSEFHVGRNGNSNLLTIADGGLVSAGNGFIISEGTLSTSLFYNGLILDGGILRITNETASGALLATNSTASYVTLNAGLLEADRVSLDTGLSRKNDFQFNGGRLATRRFDWLLPLVVGATGNIPAILEVIPSPPVLINDGSATPYPSPLTVSGLNGTITEVTVTLSGLAHSRSDDLDMLLVGPGGQRVMIMSDAGGLFFGLTNATLTLDDAAPDFLPDSTAITNGTYRPTDYENTDTLSPPAPARPYALALSTFNGTDPNGVWSLYIQDDQSQFIGSLARWSLQIHTSSGAATNVFNDSFMSLPSLTIGGDVPGCQLLLTNPAAALITSSLVVGANAPSTNNRVVVNGVLVVINSSQTAVEEIRRGTNVLDAGFMVVDRLLITNGSGQFEFNGGTLRARAITNSNGASTATLQLLGGTNLFSAGLVIANHASLIGTGSIAGLVVVQPGGTLSPGTSIGSFSLDTTPTLQGMTIMEIVKNGATRTNDQIRMPAASLVYGGALTVSNLGPTALTVGDRFQLFLAASYSGSFSPLTLPPLNSGLDWTNKLSVDGSIEVVGAPRFTNITASGTNMIVAGTNGTTSGNYAVLTATNVTLPLSNWVSIATNPFNSGGGFSFTNGIAPGELQRYFRLRSP